MTRVYSGARVRVREEYRSGDEKTVKIINDWVEARKQGITVVKLGEELDKVLPPEEYGVINNKWSFVSKVLTDLGLNEDRVRLRRKKVGETYEERMELLRQFEKENNITCPEDWYKVPYHKSPDSKFTGEIWTLIHGYYETALNAVKELYPDYHFKEWLFPNVSNNFWNSIDNRREYMIWLGGVLGYTKMEDYYGIYCDDIIKNRGSGMLLPIYNGSAKKAVQDCFNYIEWQEFRFNVVDDGWWLDLNNRLQYLAWLAEKLNITTMEGWYKVINRDLSENYGTRLAKIYGSAAAVIIDTFQDHHFKPWLFRQSQKGIWDLEENRKEYLQDLAIEFKITKPEDWYSVRIADVSSRKGVPLIQKYGGFAQMIMANISGFDFQVEDFADYKKRQKQLFKIVKRLFSGYEILWDKFYDCLRYSESGNKMQLDMFLPALRLAFEYDGEQHYFAIEYFGGEKALLVRQRKDIEKNERCKDNNFTLVRVNYTWDGKQESVEKILIESGIKYGDQLLQENNG